jgi:nucleoside-diphosphate-sugar epimerase
MIETLALAAANTNPMLKTYIVCPGFIYGCGEEIFYDYFKMAWLQDPYKIPIAGDGKNFIPTIHIKDLVCGIKRIIEKKPNIKYIFAIDKTKNKTLKNIMKSISKCVGNSLIENFDLNKDKIIHIPNFTEFTMNVKVKTSKLFSDTKMEDEDDDDFVKRCFKWHCEVKLFYSIFN